MSKTIAAIWLVAVLVLATACSGPSVAGSSPAVPAAVSAAGVQQVTIDGQDSMKFEPSAIVVKAGQPVELTFRNAGRIPHDFVLREGVSQPVRIAAQGGQTATGTFTIDRPGSYTFICSMPGHESAGMKGTITAQ